MARRARHIQNPDEPQAVQLSLIAPPGVKSDPVSPWPIALKDPEEIIGIAQRAHEALGYDLEFYERYNKEEKNIEYVPTVIGIAGITADGKRELGACKWDEQLARDVWFFVKCRKLKVVAYSLTGADKPVTEKAIGESIPLEVWEDSMVIHHLDNPDFCKMPSKDEDEDDAGALGLMNLWTAASMVTDYPQWKQCRSKACFGPCPRHDVFWYCAMDALAGLEVYFEGRKNLRAKGVPEKLYKEQIELGEVCELMSDKGLLVDKTWITELETKADEKKSLLFPYDLIDGEKVYKDFNPKSPDQILAWAQKSGIPLASTSKDDVRKVLEKEARKKGIIETGKALIERLENEDEVPEPINTLFRLDQFKNAGKGLKAWFDEKYIDKDGLIHPRFNHTGTSMGRLSSSNPNFQNVPARGWGSMIRGAIISRPGMLFSESDYSQLELRLCLWAAGVDPKTIQKDAFTWLVQKSNGAFKAASDMLNQSERQTAKSVAHAFDYMEGITVLSPRDLMSSRTKSAIDYGALRVYARRYNPKIKHDWEYRGGIVAFTGANLAERLFGSKTFENRRKALEIQEDVFAASFPMLREWQWSVLQQIESRGAIIDPCGFYLPLYGTPEEDAKMATACIGQGTSARHIQGVMLRFKRELRIIPVLQVHDSLMFEIPEDKAENLAREYSALMMSETNRLLGFVAPVKTKIGKRWGEMKEIEL